MMEIQRTQVDQHQKALNDSWGLVQNQWDVAVVQRYQQLQQLVSAFNGLGRLWV